jgi:chromosome segregation ATPase
MTPEELKEAKARLAEWNERDKQYQQQLRENVAQHHTIEANRANNKQQYAELFARVCAAEKDLAAKQAAKPKVVVAVAKDAPPQEVHHATKWQLVKALFGA